jgi:hypothetical protein
MTKLKAFHLKKQEGNLSKEANFSQTTIKQYFNTSKLRHFPSIRQENTLKNGGQLQEKTVRTWVKKR